jgi:hypothetical protein
MRKLRIVAIGVLLSTAIATVAVAGTIEETLVVGGRANQFSGDGNTSWFTWSSNTVDHRNHYDARAIGASKGDEAWKMNARHTVGFAGDIDGETNVAVYQQVQRSSNIFLYDLASKSRTSAGPVVNSDLWEWGPSISSGHILFGRNNFARRGAPWRIVLYDRGTEETLVLDSVTNACACIFPGQVSSEYATWTKCDGPRCEAWYYDIAGESTHQVPDPFGRHQYAPGVSEATEDLYFIRAGDACGQNVRLVRWNPNEGGDGVVVSSHPSGYDVGSPVHVYDDLGGHQDVFVDHYECRDRFYGDVYVVKDADTGGVDPLRADRASRASVAERLVPRGATPLG